MRTICYIFVLFLWLLDGGVSSLHNLSIAVPRAVLSGENQSALLRCSYDLEGADLYSIRWYRAEVEFYRYVPKEVPPTMVFPLPGAVVDLSHSDQHQVRIVNMNRRLSGEYQCEVSADAPLFQTDIRAGYLTVVDPPFRAPRLQISRLSYSRNDVLHANCSVDEAYPAPNITWMIDGHKVAESISQQSTELDFKELRAFSELELTIMSDQLNIDRASPEGFRQPRHDHFTPNTKSYESMKYELQRHTILPPPSGQFAISCGASIYDIYAKTTERIYIKEDSPHPASVTREDSSGFRLQCNVLVTLICATILLVMSL